MLEFDMYHKITGEHKIVFGYLFEEACVNWGYDPNDWDCALITYVD